MNPQILSQYIFCPHCGKQIEKDSNFCMYCGYVIHENLNFGKQFYIYIVSLLFPPFGLVWFFKYFRSSDLKSKRVGYIALILTIISTIVTIWWTIDFINSMQKSISQLNGITNVSGY